MTTLVRRAKRHPGTSVDDFRRQADSAADWSSAAPYGLRSATQALTLAGASPRGEAARDGTSGLWVGGLVVEEHVAKPGPVGASFVKNYELVTKRPDMDRAEFDRYWAQVHGPLAATIPTIRRYVQAHLSPGTMKEAAAPYDGLAITWFDDVAAMRAGAATEAYAETRADEANFIAGELPFVITTERTTFPL